jgi:Predicted enzyme with a TIM-barrel fold
MERVEEAARAGARKLEDITLVVVTKNHPHQLVLDLLELGARDFGENRDQDASLRPS